MNLLRNVYYFIAANFQTAFWVAVALVVVIKLTDHRSMTVSILNPDIRRNTAIDSSNTQTMIVNYNGCDYLLVRHRGDRNDMLAVTKTDCDCVDSPLQARNSRRFDR